MKGRLLATRIGVVGLAFGGFAVEQSLAQFAPSSYPSAAAPAYSQAPAYNQAAPVYPPAASQSPAYAATPTYNVAPSYQPAPPQQQGFAAAPAYGFPRVAQAGELPSPTEAVQGAASAMSSAAPAAAPVAGFSAPDAVMNQAPTAYAGAPMFAAPVTHEGPYHAAPMYGAGVGTSCETGACGVPDYSGGYANCAPVCNVPTRPRRQWFVGVYGLYLDRVDAKRQQVAYFTDTAGFTAGTPYYYQTSDAALWVDDADLDDLWGGEVRFGSTFGHDACGCGQPFAWEVGYWALDDSDGSASILINEPIGPTAGFTERLYGTIDYSGIEMDLDGAGATYAYRPMNDYNDYGVPADGDVNANDVRLLGVRVRRRFEAQNLELNFWRFGTPALAPSLLGRHGGALGGPGTCGPNGCGPNACGPSRPPRRFFINGLAGVRYFRVDDDMGIDHQLTLVDAVGDPLAGWPTQYSGFDPSSNTYFLHDIQVDNEMVGLQLGCSMNWLIGCRWNVFADSNFGVYGNNAQVRQSVVAGGASVARYVNGGTPVVHDYNETDVAFLGELRAGIGYQVSCRCRLTAAYRFIGAGGLALAADQIPKAGYANPATVQYVHNDSSLVLHGAQFGAEWKY